MSRNAVSSRRAWLWLAPAAVTLLAVVVLLVGNRSYESYESALATFHVQSSSYAVEMAAVADTLLSRTPIGSPPSAVVALLDSLGFVRSNQAFDRPTFYVDSTPGSKTIRAHRPYDDPPLSLDRFVCDRPSLRLSFGFDDDWRLAMVKATTGQACI